MSEEKLKDYNNKCTRPDGCYSDDDGKMLCCLGCDCACHDEWDEE
jgi:hypothetical protein